MSDEFYADANHHDVAVEKIAFFLSSPQLSKREREIVSYYYLVRSLAEVKSFSGGKAETQDLLRLYQRCWHPFKALFSKKFFIESMLSVAKVLFFLGEAFIITSLILIMPVICLVALLTLPFRARPYKKLEDLAAVALSLHHNQKLHKLFPKAVKQRLFSLAVSLQLSNKHLSNRANMQERHKTLRNFYRELIERLKKAHHQLPELQPLTIRI
jgi:hypothetical protein